jgi:monofunctional glycosyltransferase
MLSAARRRSRPGAERRSRVLRWLRWLSLVAGSLAVAVLCTLGIAWRVVGAEAAALAGRPPETTAFIERHRATGGTPQWTWVRWDAISDELKVGVLVAEDIEFYSHDGFSTAEIRIAIEQHLKEGRRLRGASTITQQLAKNLWLSSDRSFLRKAREALYTVALERKLRKRRILEIYLNVVEFHPGIFGAEAASRHFFGKPASALDRHEAAQLAASLPSSAWYPGSGNANHQRHAARVEARIGEAGWIRRLL